MELLDILWPKKCVNCGRIGAYVCESCKVGLWEEEQICPICTRNSRYGLVHKYCHRPWGLDGLACLWAYEGVAKKIIKKAKYKFFYDMLGELISLPEGEEYFYLQKFLESQPVVVPVPLHEKRYRERGFNQSLIISKIFSQIWHLSLSDCLIRIKDTGHQAGRERDARLEAVKNAFKISNFKFQIPQMVLLVDDVWTTGATMSECCKILKQNGAKQVWGLVLAR